MYRQSKSGLFIAGAVAAMFAAGCGSESNTEVNPSENAQSQAVRCFGINECAGHGECANPGQGNSCEGLNECAGQGWVTVDTEEQCVSAGGEVLT
jgi:hypothetical protein